MLIVVQIINLIITNIERTSRSLYRLYHFLQNKKKVKKKSFSNKNQHPTACECPHQCCQTCSKETNFPPTNDKKNKSELKRVVLIVGHNHKKQGAHLYESFQGLKSEYEFNRTWCLSFIQKNYEPDGFEVFALTREPHPQGYSAEVAKVYDQARQLKADLICELHFNFFSDRKVSGSEVLYHHKSYIGLEIASILSRHFAFSLGIKERPNKALKPGSRGYSSVNAAQTPTVILEPFFGSSPIDVNKVTEGFPENLNQALHQALSEICSRDLI